MRTSFLLPLVTVFAVGCGSEPPATTPDVSAAPEIGTAFDATKTGGITGSVTWQGPIPNPPPFLFCTPKADGRSFEYKQAENPNRPQVDPKNRAVAGAVVFLRGVDPARSRKWDRPTPVRVEMGGGQITIVQGERKGRVGFVHRGDRIEVAASDPTYHILRGRGDDFFSLTLPPAVDESTRRTQRTLSKPGRVELSSATGLYWARADLFVTDHPYFTVTDAAGRFQFEQVPYGNVEVVVWLPGWEIGKQERDPDTTAITRMIYSPSIERVQSVEVRSDDIIDLPAVIVP